MIRDISGTKSSEVDDLQVDSIFSSIDCTVNSSSDIVDAFSELEAQIQQLVHFDRIAVTLLDDERSIGRIVGVAGVDVPQHGVDDELTLMGTLAEQAFLAKTSVVCHDGSGEEILDAFPGMSAYAETGLKSFLVAALRNEDSVVGMLELASTRLEAYSLSDVELIDRVAEKLSKLALEAPSLRYPQTQVIEQQILAEIGRIVSSSLNIDDIYEGFANEVRKLVPFDSIGVGYIDAEGGTGLTTFRIGEGFDPQSSNFRFVASGTPMETMIESKSGMLVQSSDPQEIIQKYPGLAPMVGSGHKSLISVPLIAKNVVIGGLTLRSKRLNAYTEEQLAIVERIGSQIAGAVANAKVHAELEGKSNEQAVLAEIGRLMTSSLNINDIYGAFAEAMMKLVPFDSIGFGGVDVGKGTGFVSHKLGNGFVIQDSIRDPIIPGSPIAEMIETKSGILV